ncbi:MAG: glycosyltransferase, partial [Pseudomonadota bacterium]
NPNVSVLPFAGAFNYAAINNLAVEASRGEVVALVNNDVEVISPTWLTELVSWAVQPEIGCVGAKLYFENGEIQHAGIITGIGSLAGHGHKRYPGAHGGYFGRLRLAHNVSAVTGACLAIRRSLFQELGGLDDENLKVAFNDVDLGLKAMAAGYRNVWTPHAELYHKESASRGYEDTPEKQARLNREAAFMKRKWGAAAEQDPFYSPNLTREREDFSLR